MGVFLVLKFKNNKSKFILYTLFLVSCVVYGYSNFLTASQYNENKYRQIPENTAKIDIDDLKVISHSNFNSLLSEKNKTKLVLIYASWCRFCRDEIYSISEVILKYKNNKSFLPILISLDKNKQSLLDLLNKNQVSFIPYLADDSLRDTVYFLLGNYKIRYNGTIPVLALIDKNNIVYQGERYRRDKVALENLIKLTIKE